MDGTEITRDATPETQWTAPARQHAASSSPYVVGPRPEYSSLHAAVLYGSIADVAAACARAAACTEGEGEEAEAATAEAALRRAANELLPHSRLSPLMLVGRAERSYNAKACELLRAKADLALASESGVTALIVAAEAGRPMLVSAARSPHDLRTSAARAPHDLRTISSWSPHDLRTISS